MNATPPPHPGPPVLYVGQMAFHAYTCRVFSLDEDDRPVEFAPVYPDTITEATPNPEDDRWVHTYVLCHHEPTVHERENQPEAL